MRIPVAATILALSAAAAGHAEAPPAVKADATTAVEARAGELATMIDQVFSYAEPGFQEVRTSAYLAGMLEKNGFKVVRGVAGVPTAFTATWGEGGPLIALGSDIDALLGLSQTPGVAQAKPMVAGAPGHGEGHNSGLPMMIVAAISAKEVMQKNGIKGRIMVWPGVAEELIGTKAYYVRAGLFDGVDASLFAHVGSDLDTAWGPLKNTAALSVEYTFTGRTAHAAANPWDGKSALDAVELMDAGWNFKREHLPVTQRSHYVITNGGNQPNIVPGQASVWYYFRDTGLPAVKAMYDSANRIAEGAALMTDTSVTRRVLGHAASNYGNRPIAEAAFANMQAVGLPQWTETDRAFARAVQDGFGRDAKPMRTDGPHLWSPDRPDPDATSGSDDIGDIMWTVPTITIRYPSNIPGLSAHNVMAAAAMATPIAHKGALAGAKVAALTVLDLMTTPDLVARAKAWQQEVQFKTERYQPLLGPDDTPAIHLNADLMTRMRPAMEPFIFDPRKHRSYLQQLGIAYGSPAKTAP
ncbi:amidohydrolase [Novosphingobium flavum]|uniref:Amidohydrolase n=1 Tax=Novosphingobium aerophilum TaxID=2839843 RepID=A0A7X1F759_9SPHN|nr:amidohydrolase [Novosphingobium aerophilum]MBC2651623.1 amidohydrolase [Novosphingobium aerophilum]MBC2661465.1 amidohydrolase [Novosphingobium aerophilum]